MSVRILRGDCRDVLPTLPDESAHCVVTSPPYWGLRDYGVGGQLGLEPTLGEYVENMVGVFREVRRVLRRDGTLWLNMGDCYVTAPPGNKPNTTKDSSGLSNSRESLEMRRAAQVAVDKTDGLYRRKMDLQVGHGEDRGAIWGIKAGSGLKNKDLCGVPWRLAFALQEDGWWLRQDIVWAKPNPMPESIRDRCTKAHEYIFLLSRSERYYYDQEAIAEPSVYGPGCGWEDAGHEIAAKTAGTRNPAFRAIKETRNKRSVWTVPPQAFPEAHFATFPAALIEPCVLAGCPEGGTVLDPFGGAGTTGVVADRLRRSAVLVELNAEYAAMAERRLRDDAGMFAEVAAE